MSNARVLNSPLSIFNNGTVTDRSVTVGGTAANLIVAALNASTTHIFWTCTDANVRFTIDSSTPTATAGHLIAAGSSGVWCAKMATQAKVIREGAYDAAIFISEVVYL
jgi:hypothetical protein